MKYKNPPIVERLLTVTTECSDEKFYSKLEGWKAIVLDYFPVADPLNEWRLKIEERRDGLPFISNAEPELTIIHRYWRLDKNNSRYLSVRFLKDQFTINIHPTSDSPHLFEELISEYSAWLPKWWAHFELSGCTQLHLDYINLISQSKTPRFVNGKGGIEIGKVLNFLGNTPGPFKTIIPPYSSEVTMLVDEAKQSTWGMRVSSIPPENGHPPAARVDFKAATANPSFLRTQNDVLSEAQNLHTVVNQQFEAVFSNEAKASFEPIKQ